MVWSQKENLHASGIGFLVGDFTSNDSIFMSSSIGKLENYPDIDEEIKMQTSSITTPNEWQSNEAGELETTPELPVSESNGVFYRTT